MGLGEFFLNIASSAFGRWVAGLLRVRGYKRQGAQEASSRGLEAARDDANAARKTEDEIRRLSDVDLDSRLSKFVRDDGKRLVRVGKTDHLESWPRKAD